WMTGAADWKEPRKPLRLRRLLDGVIDSATLQDRIRRKLGKRALVVWSSPAWPDRLFTWWALDAIAPMRPAAGTQSIAVLAQRTLDGDWAESDCLSPRIFAASFEARRPLSNDDLVAARQIWRSYSGPSAPKFVDEGRGCKLWNVTWDADDYMS